MRPKLGQGGVENYGQRAPDDEGEPEAGPMSQQRRDKQEHRQRGNDVPERRQCMGGHVVGVWPLVPEPHHTKYRHKRQGGDQSAKAWIPRGGSANLDRLLSGVSA